MKTPIVAIDIGNTRLKWGVYQAGQWVCEGVLVKDDFSLLQAHASTWQKNAVLLVCNVAGKKMAETFKAALPSFSTIRFLTAAAEVSGMANAYDFPEKLGADRFFAALGARAQNVKNALIVSLGTATTIDVLSETGFEGGAILPGLSLMKEALSKKTAQLPFLWQGCLSFPARNTEDAMASGAVMAHLGAISQAYAVLGNKARLLLTGGGAPALSPHLTLPHQIDERLVLKGLVHFYQQERGIPS